MNVLTLVLAIAIPLGIAALTAWISIKKVRSEERVVLRAERLA
jgi:hypothetical protein